MKTQSQPTVTEQNIAIAPIDPKPIIERGNSPTAIILAIALLIAILLGSLTQLVRVILILQPKKRSR